MSADARWTQVAADGDLWEGDILGVDVAGRAILLVRLAGGAVKAYQEPARTRDSRWRTRTSTRTPAS
ncbi:hypothetical protein O1L60_38740 [Streptomyces diastatochromogenes]|nr:hypothetical protein [Streptomyces diastatochromogenes]